MREDLALKHLLLDESRKVEQSIRTTNKELAQAVGKIVETLNIEYSRQQQQYFISAIVKEKKVAITKEKKTFKFYQKADEEKPFKENKYLLGKDPITTHNQEKAKEVLKDLLSQEGLNLPNELIDKNIENSGTRFASKPLDWSSWLIVFLIAVFSAELTYYQGTATFNLIDNTYTLEVAWRILNGEVPYRDFNLVVMPGIYVKQALLMKLFDNQAIVGVWWSMLAMIITILLTHKILKLMEIPRALSISLCLIVAVGGNVVRPYVWYDVDALIFCLASVALFLWSEKNTYFTKHLFFLGVLTAAPVIFKQNIGLAHLVSVSLVVYFQWILCPNRFSWPRLFYYHLGVLTTLLILVIPFWYLGALQQMFYNTFVLAAELRVQKSIFDIFRETYPQLVEDYYLFPPHFPLPVYSSSFLTWGAIIFGVVNWFIGTHRSIFQMLIPFWIVALTVASVYALGAASVFPLVPLMAIMIASIWKFIERISFVPAFFYYAVHIIVFLLAFVFGKHALAGYQLFFYKNALINPTPFKIKKLEGMSASPEVVKGLEEMINFVNKIPSSEVVAVFITEDPIYFLTGRKPPLKVLQRYKPSGGDPGKIYLSELQKTKPDWILLKTKPQFSHGEELTKPEIDWLLNNYQRNTTLKQYLVYKKVK